MEPICSNSDSEPKVEEEKTVVQLDMRDFELRSPTGVSVDPAAFQGRGALWITESNSGRILCIEWVHGHVPGERGSLKSPYNSVKPLGSNEALEDDYEMDVKGTDGLLGQVHVVWDHSSDGIPSMVLSQSD
ncbi:hypothetical protein F1559_002051 [Cyanidiococcus yangmingshanensis]|uniref:Uncharacterized protein n=1 Tax=Cyanidiococcus yangmingshanensis TaxID=2690220 RepID=A0A7J7IG16_9RHOD|nr:hypothetical protein F1559_002051 [Cyanidiococcus yangmingshanensis]